MKVKELASKKLKKTTKTPKKIAVKKNESTELIVVLDRSGSMNAIKEDMEGGFNALIEDQKKLPGVCNVTLAQFDNEYEVVYESKDLSEVPELELIPRGFTALLDAVGRSVNSASERISKLENKPNMLCVVITDGYENASKEWKKESIKNLIESKRKEGNWEFVFLGADESSFADAHAMGFSKDTTYVYTASAVGTRSMMKDVSKGIAASRMGGSYKDVSSK